MISTVPTYPKRYVPVERDLSVFFEEFLEGQLTEGTRRIYRCDIEGFFEGTPTLEQVASLRPEDLRLWRNMVWDDGRGLAAATINRKLTALSSFYGTLIANQVTPVNPAHSKLVKRIKEKRRNGARLGITQEEMSALLLACEAESGRDIDVRDHTLISLLYTCLLRRGEAENILWKDIRKEGNRVILHLPLSKAGANDFVPLEPGILGLLDKYFHAMGGAERWISFHGKSIMECPVFLALDRACYGDGLTGHGINDVVKKRAALAGIQKISSHYLRHTAITHLLQEGYSIVDVQHLARHANPQQTIAYAELLKRLTHSPGCSLARIVAGSYSSQ